MFLILNVHLFLWGSFAFVFTICLGYCLFVFNHCCLLVFFFAISLGFCLFVFIPSFFNFIFSLFAKLCSLQILGSQARGRA